MKLSIALCTLAALSMTALSITAAKKTTQTIYWCSTGTGMTACSKTLYTTQQKSIDQRRQNCERQGGVLTGCVGNLPCICIKEKRTTNSTAK